MKLWNRGETSMDKATKDLEAATAALAKAEAEHAVEAERWSVAHAEAEALTAQVRDADASDAHALSKLVSEMEAARARGSAFSARAEKARAAVDAARALMDAAKVSVTRAELDALTEKLLATEAEATREALEYRERLSAQVAAILDIAEKADAAEIAVRQAQGEASPDHVGRGRMGDWLLSARRRSSGDDVFTVAVAVHHDIQRREALERRREIDEASERKQAQARQAAERKAGANHG
jgi:hypothetical protein